MRRLWGNVFLLEIGSDPVGVTYRYVDGREVPESVLIHASLVARMLLEALQLRFGRVGDAFDRWLQQYFRQPVVFADVWVVHRLDVKNFDMVSLWSEFREEMGARYVAEVSDCEDFTRLWRAFLSFRLRMSSGGEVWGLLCQCSDECDCGGHSFGWYISADLHGEEAVIAYVYLWEPQVDLLMIPESDGVGRIMLSDGTEIRWEPYIAFI